MIQVRGRFWRKAAAFAANDGGVGRRWAAGFCRADEGPCVGQRESRALDFWLGEWTIGVPNEHTDATSKVSLELGDCVVVERWDGGHGHVGENMFGYSADDKSWHGDVCR